MGVVYAALMLMSIAYGTYAVLQNNVALVTPAPQRLAANNDAAQFLAYRNAVSVYMASHTAFIGTIPAASLTGQYSAQFLATAGNVVTATGTSGRVITSYAKVAAGVVQQAFVMSNGDASIGISHGTTWTSAAPNAVQTPTAMNTTVPAGDIVSIIQIGT
ncbi:type IV pilus biogenesis protein PilM [Paraburkholderia largidicola]|uniref:PilM protein n=1 Tax=Paraburkholderia largidicola TaxID=3014751 RepID=A0A7I8C2T8_9BURK|nr:hypothetical protein [Paraburkholderia sp. PGU16]BCF95352.1 hypothetical protein PPGU16_84190 [Paraburkholderia sp. PGU16]